MSIASPDQSYLSIISRNPPAQPIILLISSHYLGTGNHLHHSIIALRPATQFVSLPPWNWVGGFDQIEKKNK